MLEFMNDPFPSASFRDSQAAEIRRRYQYRQLFLRGKARLPRQVLIGLIGPDCAYHLYRWEEAGRESASGESPT